MDLDTKHRRASIVHVEVKSAANVSETGDEVHHSRSRLWPWLKGP